MMSFPRPHITSRNEFFRSAVVLFPSATECVTIILLGVTRFGDKPLNLFAIALMVANIVWVIGLEITVQSKRSGKRLFKTYM